MSDLMNQLLPNNAKDRAAAAVKKAVQPSTEEILAKAKNPGGVDKQAIKKAQNQAKRDARQAEKALQNYNKVESKYGDLAGRGTGLVADSGKLANYEQTNVAEIKKRVEFAHSPQGYAASIGGDVAGEAIKQTGKELTKEAIGAIGEAFGGKGLGDRIGNRVGKKAAKSGMKTITTAAGDAVEVDDLAKIRKKSLSDYTRPIDDKMAKYDQALDKVNGTERTQGSLKRYQDAKAAADANPENKAAVDKYKAAAKTLNTDLKRLEKAQSSAVKAIEKQYAKVMGKAAAGF